MLKFKNSSIPFTDESRIQTEGQKDGEKNIPEMGSYTPAQFEQALIAHGEREVHRIYEKAPIRIAKLQHVFQACQTSFAALNGRFQRVAEQSQNWKSEV